MTEQRVRGQGGPQGRRRRRRRAGRAVPRDRRAFGITDFVGYEHDAVDARVLAVVPAADGTVEVFLDRSPFYAESGGQVGDSGTITTETGVRRSGHARSRCPVCAGTSAPWSGEIVAGQTALAAIDVEGRDATRRNHTATHLLHWALRNVLGEHVKQAGSLVSPGRLRFDFSHYAAVTPDEIERIEQLVNDEVLANEPVRAYETTKDEAAAMGAIAFFGDKYGDIVRVLEAGSKSVELCGGTHVRATGDIGTVKVVSEGSIGSNLRRIEAVTGTASVALLQRDERTLGEAARLVGSGPDDLLDGVRRKLDEIKSLQDELKVLRAKLATGRAAELAIGANDGVVVARVDGLGSGELRDLALAVRQQPGITTVVLGGETDTGGAALVAAVTRATGRRPTSSRRRRRPFAAVVAGRAMSPWRAARIPAGSTRRFRSRGPPRPRG